MKKIILSSLLLVVSFFNVNAQGCGTPQPTASEYAYTRDVVSNIMLTYNAGTICVPIRPHIVRHTDGSGGISLGDINKGISHLNEYYYGMGVEFYLCGTTPDFIDNDTYYDFQSTDENAMATAGNEVTNAINMYFVNGINYDPLAGSFTAGYAYFPANSIFSTRIVMRNGSTANGGTLIHELGHHYNLYHTFQSTVNGNTAPNAENVPRVGANANCATSGDLLCGTEADPGYNFAVPNINTTTCTYTGGDSDINGVAYTPMLDNVMSYFPDACQNPSVFTVDQYFRMQQGKVIRDGHSAYTMDCPASAVANPSGLTAALVGGIVTLSWTDNANNELGYFIERSTVSAVSGFKAYGGMATDIDAITFIDNSTSANTTYYYRVKAVNDNCNDYSNVATVSTTYCPANSNTCDEFVSRVQLNTIDNANAVCTIGGYHDYSAMSTDLTVGTAYPITVTNGTAGNPAGAGYTGDQCGVWVDWNQDNDFDDPGETIVISGGVVSFTGNITPPITALAGNTKMRVRITFTGIVDPCGSTAFGEVEDYTVNVISTACGISTITAGTQTTCVPATNTYTQEIIVTYTNAPATGTLDVNGQSFVITTSPQTVVLTNLTSDGNTVDVTAVFSADNTCTNTVVSLFTAAVDCTPVCNIASVTAGTQTTCVPATNTYTQEIIVTYTNAPAIGTLDVNGQSFVITTSPQTVVLTNLASDGNTVDVTAVFSADNTCTNTVVSLFTAAVDCTPVSTTCASENFNNASLTTSYANGNFIGNNSVTWTYVASRNESTYGIIGNGIMLRRLSSGSKVASSAVVGGIADFTCSLRKAFTSAGNRQVELFVNGVLQGTSIAWDNTMVQTFTVTGINITGNVIVEVRNITSRQVIVDDISWTCYTAPAGTPTITVGNNNMNGFTYQEGSGPSTSQTNTLAWNDLAGNVSSTNIINYFEFSNDGGTTWLNANSLNILIPPFPVTSAAPINIDVRLKPALLAGTYLDTVVLSSTGATTKVVYLEGIVTALPLAACSELFISEYGEPNGGSNKYIEIYNPTANTVDLSNYELWKIVNGGSWPESTFSLSGMLNSGDVFVIANNNFDPNVDLANVFISFTGDDAIGLASNGGSGTIFSLIDAIGTDGLDPGSGWAVAGINNATQNAILKRKTTIDVPNTDWISSAGTTVANSEWEVIDPYTGGMAIPSLGTHITACVAVCDIASISTGVQTACVPATNTYTQEVIVTYSTAPATGTLDVNGQSFAITASPQTVVLTNLVSDGNTVDVTANFSANTSCTYSSVALFTAQANCSPTCNITGITSGVQTACVPATNTYTQEVIVTYANAPATGTLDVNGQSFAITASPQTVVLTNLTSDGNNVNITAVFSADNSCTNTVVSLFMAAADCTPSILCAELMITEYVEGSASNKYIEIYNPTSLAVDLSNYDLVLYTNGSISPSAPISLSGMLASGAVYVVAHTSAVVWLGTADQTTGSLVFNGNDVVALRNNGNNIDVFGVIGSNANFAANTTKTRMTSIQVPTTTYNNAEWNTSVSNTVTDLGTHITACVTPTTYVWTGMTDTDWNTATNWSDGVVPASTDDVTIADVSGMSGNFPLIAPATILANIDVDVNAILTVATGIILNGTVTNNGTVILQDGAYLDDFTNAGASFVGNITIETVATNGVSNDQRMISSPVNTPNISEIADDLNGPWGVGTPGVNGIAITVADCATPTLTTSSNYGNLFEYNETLVTSVASCPLNGWVVRSSGSLENARGYSAYLTNGNTFDFQGTPNTGNISIATTNTGSTITEAEGWNLLGNPYPSPIGRDDLITAGATDISYFVTTGVYQGSYTSYGIGSNVAVAQGFQAHVNASGNIQFTNAMRNTNNATWYANDEWFEYKLEVSVFGANYADKTTLFYNNEATNNYEPMFDVRKRNSNSGQPTLSTYNSTKELVMNGMSINDLGETVPMNLLSGSDGTFTLQFEGMETFPEHTTIYVKDLFTNTIHNIANGDFTFTANETDAKERFELIFIPEVALVINHTDCNGNIGNISLTNSNNTANRTFELFTNYTSIANNHLTALNIDLVAGNYILNVNDQYGGMQIYNIEIKTMEMIEASFNLSDNSVEVGEIVSFHKQTTNTNKVSWVIDNQIFTHTDNLTYSFENAGIYDVIMIVENADCSDAETKTITVSNKTTGIKDLVENTITIYPNPVNDMLFIETNETVKIEIVNVLAKKVLTSFEKHINVKEINAGVYFIYIYNTNNELISINKIIKE